MKQGLSSFSLPSLPWKAIILYGTGIVVAIGLIYVFVKGFSLYDTIKIDSGNDATAKAAPAKKEQKVFNILLTGYGGEGHDGSYLTDTLMIAHIDTEKQKVVLFSVPRDLWVAYPTEDNEEYYSKINAVYQSGLFQENYPAIPDQYAGEENAPQLIKTVMEDVTGLEVDYFLGVDFSGFTKAIDTLGGIEVEVERTFDDYFYPIAGKEEDLCGREPQPTLTEDELKGERERYEAMSPEEKEAYDNRPVAELNENEFQKIATEEPELAFPCRYEHLHFDAGMQTMDGETALKFARSRKSLQDGGDFNRAARQQRVVEAIKDKVLSIGFIPKILPTLDTLSEHVRTDMPLSQIQKFLGEAPNADKYAISTFVIGDEFMSYDVSYDGQSIVVPKTGIDDYSEIQQAVQNVVQEITPTPTPDPSIQDSEATGSEASIEEDDHTQVSDE